MKALTLPLLFAIAISLMLSPARAADNSEPLILVSHCMKSTSSDYVNVEKELWQPLHQQMVDQGMKNSWAVYWVMYGDRSRCDYFVIETYLGMAQYNKADESMGKVYAQVFNEKDFNEFIGRTESSRTMVESSLWVMQEGVEVKPHSKINVNWMKTEDPEKYLKIEREIWQPIHQYSLKNGHSNGWAVYQLLFPMGDLVPYNFVTVDFLTDMKHFPFESIVKKVHPGKSMQEMGKMTEKSRRNVLTQTWSRVTGTSPKAK